MVPTRLWERRLFESGATLVYTTTVHDGNDEEEGRVKDGMGACHGAGVGRQEDHFLVATQTFGNVSSSVLKRKVLRFVIFNDNFNNCH